MMIDIDDFKFYNDRNGHQAGDRALEITAQCLRAALRKVDVASRYGGEEVSLLPPQKTLQEAGGNAGPIPGQNIQTKIPPCSSPPPGDATKGAGHFTFLRQHPV